MPSDNRAALYARVSTDEQAMKGYSLDAQLEKMSQYCEIYNLQIAGEYVDDGYSGTKCSNRPAYKRMFQERKNWDILIVLKMDRIHRNTVEFINMMDDLRKNHEAKINEFLSGTKKYDGVMIVAPFIGGILKIEEFRARDLQLTDLEFAFIPYYNKPASAVRRLSDKMDSAEANMLFSLLKGMLKKYPKS